MKKCRVKFLCCTLCFVFCALFAPLLKAAPDFLDHFERGLFSSTSSQGGVGKHFASDLFLGQIDGAYYLNLNPHLDLNFADFGLGLQIPLNIRIYPWGEEANARYGKTILRAQDWDETHDYLKMIRYISYGEKRSPVFFRLGSLYGKIGHGTILNNYVNNLDINTFRLGMQLDVNTRYMGFEFLIGDSAGLVSPSIGSQVLGLRYYIKPLSFFGLSERLNFLSLGASVIGDFSAPVKVHTSVIKQSIAQDKKTEAVEIKEFFITGFDIEAQAVQLSFFNLVPFLDVNFMHQAGTGVHLGLDMNFKLPFIFKIQIPMLAEFRYFQSNYMPQYFSSMYEIERNSFFVFNKNQTKYGYLMGLEDEEWIAGLYAEMGVDFASLFKLGLVYEHYSKPAQQWKKAIGIDIGDDFLVPGQGQLAVYLNVAALKVIQFQAYYLRTGIENVQDAFAFDEKSMLVAKASYQVLPFLSLLARYNRLWVLDNDSSDAHAHYKSVETWRLGCEFKVDF